MVRIPSLRPGRAADDAPAVRAKILQHWLAFAEGYDATSAARLAPLLSARKRATIRDTASLAWLPMALDIEAVDAVAEAMGPKRFSAFARAFFLEIMPRPPLSALFDLGTKLMGLSPESFLKWWSKGWDAVYRDCGTVRCVFDGSSRGRLVFENMPRMCLASEAFVELQVCAAYGIYTLAGTSGVVRVGALDPKAGTLELVLEWRQKRASLAKRLSRASQPRGPR